MTYGEQYTLVPGPGIVPSWTGTGYTHDGQIRQVIHSDDQVYSVNLAQGRYNLFNIESYDILNKAECVFLMISYGIRTK